MAYVVQDAVAVRMPAERFETAESALEQATSEMGREEYRIWWMSAGDDPLKPGAHRFTWWEDADYEFAIEDALDKGRRVHVQSTSAHVTICWED